MCLASLRFARERGGGGEGSREDTFAGGRSVRINSPCTRANMVHNLYETHERARGEKKRELVKDRNVNVKSEFINDALNSKERIILSAQYRRSNFQNVSSCLPPLVPPSTFRRAIDRCFLDLPDTYD